MRSSIRLCAVLVLALGLGSSTVRAQAETGATLAAQGNAALDASRYEEALQAFSKAYTADSAPASLYGRARAHEGLGQIALAIQAYEAYIGFAEAAEGEKDQATIDKAKAAIENIKTNAGRFVLNVVPPTAAVLIDGQATTLIENEVWIMPGRHTIDVRADGYDSFSQGVDVATGRYTLDINLRMPTLSPPERAIAMVDEGMLLYTQGSVGAAITKFQEAEKIHSTPRGLAQLGFAEETMGDLGAAEAHLNQSLVSKKDPWIRKNRAKIRKSLANIKKKTRQMAKLDVVSAYPGARIFVNEQPYGALPRTGTIYVTAGQATLRTRLAGYYDFVLTSEMPRRALKRVQPMMDPLPAIPTPPPPPPAEEEPDGPSQSDIEAAEEPPPDMPKATGFELALNGGYLMWLDDGLSGMTGGPAVQLHLGARPVWFLSFGLELINGGVDMGVKGTKAAGAANPGFYLRGHSQKHQKKFTFDIWGGVGIQPIAMQFSVLDSKDLDPLLVAQATRGSTSAIATNEAMNQAGVSGWMSLESMNVPIELGTTFYVTPGVGFDLSMALTFWLPRQMCLHDDTTRFCSDADLKTQKTFFIGGGFSFLP